MQPVPAFMLNALKATSVVGGAAIHVTAIKVSSLGPCITLLKWLLELLEFWPQDLSF